MASSAASMAASRVLNLSNSSLRSVIYRHLLRPAAAATSTSTPTPHIIKNNISNPEQLLFNPFYSERRSLDLVNPSFNMKNLNTDAANLPQNLERAIGFSASKIEADRHRGPVKDEDSDDSDYDDDKDDDDYDDDDDNDEDEDEDDGPPRRFRNYE